MNNQSGIYAVIHDATGRRYVGQAVDIGRRWIQHRHHLKKGVHTSPHLQRAWIKYGAESFAFEVLEFCQLKLLDEREQFHLDQQADFNTLKLARSPRGVVRSQQTKDRIAQALRGKPKSVEHRANLAKAGVGKVQSEESRAKKSQALKGRVITPEHRAKISAANKGRKLSPETIEKIRMAAQCRSR